MSPQSRRSLCLQHFRHRSQKPFPPCFQIQENSSHPTKTLVWILLLILPLHHLHPRRQLLKAFKRLFSFFSLQHFWFRSSYSGGCAKGCDGLILFWTRRVMERLIDEPMEKDPCPSAQLLVGKETRKQPNAFLVLLSPNQCNVCHLLVKPHKHWKVSLSWRQNRARLSIHHEGGKNMSSNLNMSLLVYL